jgi:predicted regulator of Ras-like GTPase activity (Roadblock/LC7/MglB family)
MEKIPSKIIKKHGSNWKNHVEEDLKLLLDVKGALGVIVTSRNGDIITQRFKDVPDMPKQKENALMQLVKKAVQTINGMRNTPLRRVIFETEEGSVVLYNAENAVIGCLLDKDYDLLTVMLEIKTVGELIGSHLNSGELTREEFEKIVTRDPGN